MNLRRRSSGRSIRRASLIGGLCLALLAGAMGTAQAATQATSASSAKATSCAASSVADAVTATMLAKECGKAVDIDADQTAYSQVSVNSDGTRTYTSTPTPRWVQQDGSWVAADADLVANSDGSFSPAAAESGLKLSGGNNTALATVTTTQGSWAVSWPSSLPVPTVSGPSATYANVMPGVNLVVTAETTGAFEESLVVETRQAATDPGLGKLVLASQLSKGLSASADASGNVTVKNAAGQTVFSSPTPRAWDSSTDPKPVPVPVSYTGTSATMQAPTSLLTSASTTFPVIIDPSYTVGQTWTAYDEIQSAYPTAEELNATYNGQVSVGYDGGGIDRGYYVFGLPTAAQGPTTQVLSATVTATAVTTFTNSSINHTINASYTSQATSTTSWNSPPTSIAGPTAVNFTTASTSPNLAVPINVASWVQTDLQANGWQFTLGLINSSETNGNQFVEFGPSPTLSITYDQAPYGADSLGLSPQNWAANGSLYTSSLTPTLQAHAYDPLSNPLEYEFKVQQGSTVIEDVTSGYFASGATGSLATTTSLSNNTTYSLYVRPYDGTVYGPWSSAQPFTTDATAPVAPTVTCTGYPAGAWTALISGGTTCSFSDTSTLVQGYTTELQNGSGSPVWSWVTGSSGTFNLTPTANGLYTLTVTPVDDANVNGASKIYTFGVGTSGAMLAPSDGSQTAAWVSLQAAVPGSYTGATFQYRLGTTGTFTTIPNHVTVDSCGCTVTWPTTTNTNPAGVQTGKLTWYVDRTIANDGLVQVEAVFSNSTGPTLTTPPVSVTLSRTGSGVDFGTTSAGPVTVGLQSGNAALSTTDVDIPSYGADLLASRTFNSVNPSATGIFGPGWVAGVGSTQASSYTSVTDDSSYVVLTAADGATYTFTQASTSGSTVSYTADANAVTAGLTLTKNTSTNTYSLVDASNNVTAFSYSSGVGNYVPTTITSPGTASSTGIVYNTAGHPLLVVAPDPASTSASTTVCPNPPSSSTWTAGCRGLSFTYNASSAVSQIDFVYVDNSSTYHDVVVAKYSYDSSGRLTSEWDPRLSTPLVSGYSYDETTTDADYGRITVDSPAQAASSGALASWHFTYDDTATDVNYGKLVSVSRTHSSTYGGTTATNTLDYGVPLTVSAGGPVNVDATTAGTWNQTDTPTSAVAVWPGGYVPSSTTSPTQTDYQYATVDYFDASGHQVNSAAYIDGNWAVATTQYDAYGNVISTLSAADRAAALNSTSPPATALALSTINVYACDNYGTVGACTTADQFDQVESDTYSPARTINVDGVQETGRTHSAMTYDAGAPNSDVAASGNPYMLPTSTTTSASVGSSIPGSSTADTRTTKYVYTVGTDNTGWTLGTPLQTVTDPTGLNLISTVAYNENSSLYNGDNLVIDQDQPSDPSGGTAGDTHTVYYTASTNSQVASCGNKPEWANLPCQVSPAAQPSDTSNIPTVTYTYTDYLAVLTQTKTYGTTGTETNTESYDSLNRPTGQSVTMTGTGMGTAPPTTAAVYSSSSGLPTDAETLNSSDTVTSDVKGTYDDFGQQITYTDANNQATGYTYNLNGQAATRTAPHDVDTVTYSPGGQQVKEVDQLAGTFTATYNPDSEMQNETYPDGTVATYAIDATGTPTQLTYSNTNWSSAISDAVFVNAQGDWASESKLNDSKTYNYDIADRLTSVQDTYAGSCTTRAYGYDSDSNRTSLAVYNAATGGACQTTTSASSESYTYDSADRLASTTIAGTTSPYTYDTQGDVTSTPAADADGAGALSAAYYGNGMVNTQTQGTTSDSYTLDGTLSRYNSQTNSATGYTTVNDYSDSGDSPSWTTTNSVWTADVTGLTGTLGAQVTQSGAVSLQLTDLHGDVLATVNPSSDAAPTATYTYTEFGAPESSSSTPGAYGYLGADQRSGAALGGTILMGQRAYNPSTGRFDSTDPIFEGSANAYDYVNQNPVTGMDVSGQYTPPSDPGCTCTASNEKWSTIEVFYGQQTDWTEEKDKNLWEERALDFPEARAAYDIIDHIDVYARSRMRYTVQRRCHDNAWEYQEGEQFQAEISGVADLYLYHQTLFTIEWFLPWWLPNDGFMGNHPI
jgi:RHS repeat-associated protein